MSGFDGLGPEVMPLVGPEVMPLAQITPDLSP